jgi:hypothetical protein
MMRNYRCFQVNGKFFLRIAAIAVRKDNKMVAVAHHAAQ